MAPSFTRFRLPALSLSCTDTPLLIRESAQPPARAAESMSALVSALLALAFDQLWLPLQQEVAANAAFLYGDVDAEDELPPCPVKSPERDPVIDTTHAKCNSNTSNNGNKKQQRSARRKKQSPAPQPKSALPVETAKKDVVENLSSDFHSDASTCGSSDEEDHDDAEDIGERERKLMLARAQQVRNITLQQQQQSRIAKRATSRKKSAAAPLSVAPVCKQPHPESSYPDVCTPLRLRNVTNTLWHWSVFSGFQVDRFPLLQDHDCDTIEADEEAWEGSDLRDQLLQMLDEDDGK